MATVTRRVRRGSAFFGLVLALLTAFVVYVATRLVPDAWPLAGRVLGFASVVALVAGPLTVLLVTRTRIGAAMLPLGLFIFLLSFTALRDLLWAIARAVDVVDAAWFDTTSAGVVALSFVAFASAVLRARSGPTVVDVDVPIAGLHPELHGFTIAQLSDVHIGRTLQRSFLEGVVAAVNALDVDLVAITGDLVDGSVAELRTHTQPLADLKSRHGTFFVTGNHDYYSGALAWIDELRSLGLRVLVNAHEVLEHDGARVVVGGVTDHSMGASVRGHASDPHQAIAGAPADTVRVLLAHQPASAHEAARAGFHLQLSGHTHGGQFFPGTWFARFIFPFVSGLNRLGELWVYTSHGTGFVGPPLRTTRVATEVTRLRLVSA